MLNLHLKILAISTWQHRGGRNQSSFIFQFNWSNIDLTAGICIPILTVFGLTGNFVSIIVLRSHGLDMKVSNNHKYSKHMHIYIHAENTIYHCIFVTDNFPTHSNDVSSVWFNVHILHGDILFIANSDTNLQVEQ